MQTLSNSEQNQKEAVKLGRRDYNTNVSFLTLDKVPYQITKVMAKTKLQY